MNKKLTSKDMELLFDLIDSKTVLICYNVTEPSPAINSNKDLHRFKLYLSDIGLFTTMLFNDKSLIEDNIYNKLLSDKLDANLGYLYENFLAQIIKSSGRELFYYYWYDENNKHSYEVDFLVSNKSKIIPIEVKSGNIKNHKSMDLFIKKYSHMISRRILFAQKDISNDEMVEIKPIYLTPSLIDSL